MLAIYHLTRMLTTGIIPTRLPLIVFITGMKAKGQILPLYIFTFLKKALGIELLWVVRRKDLNFIFDWQKFGKMVDC